MKYRKLGSSDLEVSEISLGSWLTYGVGVEAETARACLDEAFDQQINFIDTANVYGRGAAETFLGEALQGRASSFRRKFEARFLTPRPGRPCHPKVLRFSSDDVCSVAGASNARLSILPY